MPDRYDELAIFSGNSNPSLVEEICHYIGLPVGRAEVFKFSNDNTFVRIGESVRQNDVFVVQSFTTPVNDAVMELLIMIDILKRASAGRITAVIPYYGYGRTDKKDQPRVPITARLVAKLIVHAPTRPEAIARMRRALGEFAIQGIKTTLPLHRRILDAPDFAAGDYTIHWLERFVAQRQALAAG